ncbi:hypothetical protein RV10_GL003535 [Enterococcus pallens]|nr:hypothetical protein RV10_GL003535 [Enterococcus pallens]
MQDLPGIFHPIHQDRGFFKNSQVLSKPFACGYFCDKLS